jgi:hypothetical protein
VVEGVLSGLLISGQPLGTLFPTGSLLEQRRFSAFFLSKAVRPVLARKLDEWISDDRAI